MMKSLRFTQSEKAYFLYYLKTNTRLIVVTMILLFLLLNQSLFPGMVLSSVLRMFNGYNGYAYTTFQQTLYVFVFVLGGLSFLITLFQFRFLMKKNSSDMYMALPVSRKRLFYLQYIIGMALLVGMTLSTYLILVIVQAVEFSVTGISMICFLELLACLLYSVFTWVCVRCSTLFDACFVMVLYTVLPILLLLTLRAFDSVVMREILVSSYYGMDYNTTNILWIVSNFISLPWLFRSTLSLFDAFQTATISFTFPYEMIVGYFTAVITWIFFSFYLYHAACRSFVQRKSEVSEERTQNSLTYPILLPLLALSLLMICGVSKNSILWIVVIFFIYLGASFIIQRKISFSWKLLVQYIVMVCAIGSVQWILVESKIFGTVVEIVDVDEVEHIELFFAKRDTNFELDELGNRYENNLYYQFDSEEIKDKNKIAEIIKENEKLLPYADEQQDQLYQVQFNYYLNDDIGYIHRSYGFKSEEQVRYAKQLIDRWLKDGVIKEQRPYDETSNSETYSEETVEEESNTSEETPQSLEV